MPNGTTQPNIVLIVCDDIGYGDLGCYGSPYVSTPELDRLASEGIRFTSFQSGGPLCTPSRASMLTGRYASRYDLGAGVIFPGCADHGAMELPASPEHGLPAEERTVATELSRAGYETNHVGKWHLGDEPPHRPTDHGFDSYYGIPYSNDMYPAEDRPDLDRWVNVPEKMVRDDHPHPHAIHYGFPELPLYRDEEIVEQPVDQTQITSRYADEAVRFVEESASGDDPFFLYLAHTMPHVPLHRSERFRGTSRAGIYGDVIAEIDWSVGRLLDVLERTGIRDETLVVFTSDHGAGANGGSNGPFRGSKGSVWEGGMRVPALASLPGTIPEGVTCSDLVANPDLFSTFLSLAGTAPPTDRPIDGVDVSDLLRNPIEADSPRTHFVYHDTDGEVGAVRDAGGWKLHLPSGELYHLHTDVGERDDRSLEKPSIVGRLREYAHDAAAAIDADEEI